MKELDELKQLLDDYLIDYETIGQRTVALTTKPLLVNGCPDGLYIFGWGFSGIWSYSAKFVSKLLDRKFREEMEGIKKGQIEADPLGY